MSDILDRPAESAATDLLPLLRRVAGRIAPLWPLQDFVAVNPFLGLAEQPFGAALARLSAIGGVETLPPRAVIAEALAEGRVTEADLTAALA
ncbi:MAG: putative inorganic carbon transporter subunit DabA, partial [Roseococcus sp.]